jgi:hypothetical protein
VKNGTFDPDATRSGHFVAKALPLVTGTASSSSSAPPLAAMDVEAAGIPIDSESEEEDCVDDIATDDEFSVAAIAEMEVAKEIVLDKPADGVVSVAARSTMPSCGLFQHRTRFTLHVGRNSPGEATESTLCFRVAEAYVALTAWPVSDAIGSTWRCKTCFDTWRRLGYP